MSKLSLLGRVMYATGSMRTYENGDAIGFVWRWWHPIAWILCPLCLIINVLIYGILQTWEEKHRLGLCMDPWFKEHPEKLKWTNHP